MPKVKFDTGQTVEFATMPTQQDIEDAAQQLGISKQAQEPAANQDQTSPNGFLDKYAPLTTKVMRAAPGAIQDFGTGAMEGASFGTASIDKGGNIIPAPSEQTSTPGSIMLSNGQARPSFMEKNFTPNAKNIGRAVGGIIPMVVSELLGGAPAEALALKYGMGPVQQAMNAAGMTMASYEGLKGAAQAKPPLETVNNMATGYTAGLPMGALAYGANKAGQLLTKDVPEGIANEYLNPPAKIADSLKQKGKPSLGSQLLNSTEYGGGMSKDAVYGDINGQLENNRMLIKNKLAQADEVLKTPNQPDVPVNGTPQLTYSPTKIASQEPAGTPQFPYTGRLPSGASAGIRGEKLLVGDTVKTTQPGDELYQTLTPGRQIKSDYGGITSRPTNPESNLNEMAGSLKTPERYDFGGFKNGGINLDEVRAEAAPLVSEQSDIGKTSAANSIDSLMGNVANGEKIVTNQRAFDLLTKLDAEVNKAYSAIDPNTIPPDTEARAAMANKLRDLLRKNVPGLDALLSQNHRLQLMETSLLPQVSGRAPIAHGGGWFKPAIAEAVGSRIGLGVARGLQSVGQEGTVPNTILESGIKPVADVSSKIGLADYIDRRSSNARKW